MTPEFQFEKVVEVRDDLQVMLHKLAHDQLSRWPLARDNYRALKNVATKTLTVNGLLVNVQFNPARAISSKAKTDPDSLRGRPCFLCAKNRPSQQQFVGFEGSKGKKYHIQVNPYPIFPEHFVIPSTDHTPQSISHRATDILTLARRFRDFTFIYNGPHCGASAPDHCHFQAFPSSQLPLEREIRAGHDLEYVSSVREARLFRYRKFARGVFAISGHTRKSVAKMLYRLLDCAPVIQGESEPRFNLYCWCSDDGYHCIVVMRKCHRSSHYFSDDPRQHLAISPGCVDMGGLFITVEKDDFEKLDSELLEKVVDEVSIAKEGEDLIVKRLTRIQQSIEADLLCGRTIDFEILSDGAGRRTARVVDSRIEYGGAVYDELFFEARTLSTLFAEPSFVLYGTDATELPVPLRYAGALRLVCEDGVLKAINVIGVEDYILAILSSLQAEDETGLMKMAVALRSDVLRDVSLRREMYPGLAEAPGRETAGAVDGTWGETVPG